MFRVVLDFGGIVCEGFRLLSLSISQLPNKVANLNVVGLFEIVGWAASYHTMAQRFWVGESGPIQLQLTLSRLVHKLKPILLKL